MKRTFFTIICLAIPALVSAQEQCDFDSDNVSDVTYTTASGTELLWKATGSTSATEELNQTFGLTTDGIVLAHWKSASAPHLGVVRLDASKKHIVWKVLHDGAIEQKTFGNADDLVVSGGDYDGDGITDAAVVRIVNKKLVWYVSRGLFSDDPKKSKKYTVGVTGDRSFFMNYDGTTDWLAAFGKGGKKRARLYLKNSNTGKTKTIRGFPSSLTKGSRPRPFPIQQIDGTDLIGFATTDETDTTISVYNTAPSKLLEVTLPGLGTVFVGDFVAGELGEEIAFQSGTKITFVSPISTNRTTQNAVGGTPVDEINFVQVLGPTPTVTQTAAPTSTPTATPSPTPTP